MSAEGKAIAGNRHWRSASDLENATARDIDVDGKILGHVSPVGGKIKLIAGAVFPKPGVGPPILIDWMLLIRYRHTC